jgi:hypothetical protein
MERPRVSDTESKLKVVETREEQSERRAGAERRQNPPEASAGNAKPRAADYDDLYRPQSTSVQTIVFFLFVAAVIVVGWYLRGEEQLVAESGAGYALGIVGSSMMLLLLLYPVRKKARFMRNLGAIKYWFRAHMLLGVIGPVLVLYHCNFNIGSTNSSVVLYATLLVAGSGLVGRYIYTKIHYGLYGRQLTLRELQEDLDLKKSSLVFVMQYAPKLRERLLAFDDMALKNRESFVGSFGGFLSMSVRGRWTHLALLVGLRRVLKVVAKRSEWSDLERRRRGKAARKHISIHMNSALRIAEFNVYERFMSLWHLLHFPLFIMLVIAGAVHILAVHMY